MRPAVVDSSVLIDMLSEDGGSSRRELAARELHAPQLLGVEVLHWMRRLSLREMITPTLGNELLRQYRMLPIIRHDHEVLLPRVWELRHNVSAYDAIYVSLAEALRVPLITRDLRLAKAAAEHCEVLVP